MVEFKAHNGKKGVDRVSRTATGYQMYVYNPGNPDTHKLEDDGAEMLLARGVEDDNGRPFIEIEFVHINTDSGKEIIEKLLAEVMGQKNIELRKAESAHSEENVCYHADQNCLSEIFDLLLQVNLPNGQPLIPDAGRNFVLEQQKVRHGLEQSLLNAFGQDMYARPTPSNRDKTSSNNIPKSEVNRIARLVEYFRKGVSDTYDTGGATA